MIVGGQTFTGSNTTETNRVYIWRSGAIETNVITMTTARSKHEAVLLDDGSVLVVGGMRAPGGAVAELIVYEPSVGGYTVSSVVLPHAKSRLVERSKTAKQPSAGDRRQNDLGQYSYGDDS